ncbi:hypothetical protein ACJX0J_005712, partial [Zea mays]
MDTVVAVHISRLNRQMHKQGGKMETLKKHVECGSGRGTTWHGKQTQSEIQGWRVSIAGGAHFNQPHMDLFLATLLEGDVMHVSHSDPPNILESQVNLYSNMLYAPMSYNMSSQVLHVNTSKHFGTIYPFMPVSILVFMS